MGQERICDRHEVAAIWNKNGMFGRPTGNTFALVSSICRFLDEEAFCSVVTQNSFLSEVLNDMRRAMEITCFGHG